MLYTEILNNNRDFLALYHKGKFTASKNIVIYVRKNNLPFNRLGITAGKKIGNAVHRNRAKRLIREAYRGFAPRIKGGMNIIFAARVKTASASLETVKNAMNECFEKAGLFKDENN